MDTLRVDIAYRPLRICWAIEEGDIDAFRKAVRLSHVLWGGLFNPIVMVGREDAEPLVELFRPDLILPIGDGEISEAFRDRFKHLVKPPLPGSLFLKGLTGIEVQVLDVRNALVHLNDTPKWKAAKEMGFKVYTWGAEDPMADVFMMQFGAYPRFEECGIDYRAWLTAATEAREDFICPSSPIRPETLKHLTVADLSSWGLERHHSVSPGLDRPGFFVGDASSLNDLVCYWNLRATDIPLWFVDPSYSERYGSIIPAWENLLRERGGPFYWERFGPYVGVWAQREEIDCGIRIFGELKLKRHDASLESWSKGKVMPPMMYLGGTSTLGVVGHSGSKPKVSFQLADKPFCGEDLFYSQHLVASVSFFPGLPEDERYSFRPPFIPELNESYARSMHFRHNRLRIESERIGLIISAAETHASLHALPVVELIARILGMAGYSAELSSGGLVARQLIAQLGGLGNALVFKIPGVRRLLKQYGPATPFKKNGALQLIGSNNQEGTGASFKDYQNWKIEPLAPGGKLRPADVFGYLVEKGLFRIGVQLSCPTCRMASWTALDTLRQRVVCDLCGASYDATRQLMSGDWYYRRSGVLGAERNAQGAVPVALTLEQLKFNFLGTAEHLYSPSLDLKPLGADCPECEVDFVWVTVRRQPERTVIILGECKDQGGVIDSKDLDNLSRVAKAFPRKRFDVFIVLAKLSAFTSDEVRGAIELNDRHRSKVILLTNRELELRGFFDGAASDLSMTPEGLALATAERYFKEPG